MMLSMQSLHLSMQSLHLDDVVSSESDVNVDIGNPSVLFYHVAFASGY
jgi:hypothetical protein